MIGGLRNIVMKVLYGVGVADRSARRHRKKGLHPVLLFHRVSPYPDPYWPPLPPHAFRQILTLFSKYYRLLPVEELVQESSLPEDAAFITFDDAFADFQEEALPILEELQLPATLFVPSGSIDKGEIIWPSLVDRYLESACETGNAPVELGGVRFEPSEIERKGKEAAVGSFKEQLMKLPYDGQMEVRKTLEGKGFSDRIRPMTWEGLKELPESIGLGAHTVHHPYLPSLKDEAEIEQEMKASKERIQEMTGRRVRTFAYPFGGVDERAQAIASEHFDLSFTTEGSLMEGMGQKDKLEKQCIPRIDIHDRDPQEALLRVVGFHRKLRSFLPF
ncbi:MAG: polysaccharide deacetylase family protein [Flavobacteriales bacterium]